VLDLLAVPFLACLVLTGIHAYLGLHVLARGVIFVDLALAQVAALGIALAFLAGHPIRSEAAYWYALAFTLGGAALFAASRTRRAPVPQEAIIGIVYAVSAAAAVLVVDQAPQGSEHIKQLLVGSLLTVTPGEVGALALLYSALGVLHWAIRRPLLEISFGIEAAAGRAVRWWDFVFYASFGVVVTSSVRVAGVLLVFSYLIVPATVGALVARSVAGRLATGWALGLAVSAAGLAASYAWDLPTGATVVVAFGVCLASVALALTLRALARAVRERGAVALRGPGAGLCVVLALAGLFLALVPQADHPWLAGLRWLLAGAVARRLPVLGVCLGGQLLVGGVRQTRAQPEMPDLGRQVGPAQDLLTARRGEDRPLGRRKLPLGHHRDIRELSHLVAVRFDHPPVLDLGQIRHRAQD